MGSVDFLKTIRIRVGGGTKTPKELELIGEIERTIIKTNDYGNYSSFDMAKDETIIGMYGESFDNHYNCFKYLGFIIGKLS
jgi:hypothetical protein